MNVDRNLIFDLGMHRGFDSKFYLDKGFRVVAIEAVPGLAEQGRSLNQTYAGSGQLTIVERALWHESGKSVTFHVNDEHDDWGSLEQSAAEKGVSSSRSIKVETVSLSDLFDAHGLPYFLKCDLEGGDAILAAQLHASGETPTFVSIEATAPDDLALIRACGYDRFQVVNQYAHPWTKAPNPAREGTFVDQQFDHHMSGLFGRELDDDNWVDFGTMMHMFLDWYGLRGRHENLGIGWLDVHATTSDTLDQHVS